ncbi:MULTISPECIES: hypothetical protein [Cupriavidus]
MKCGFWRAAIGHEVRELPEESCLTELWAFLNEQLANQTTETAVVFEDQHGYRVGEIWDSSLFYALAETPATLAGYLRICSFGEEPTD